MPRDAPKSLACPPASSLPSVAAWLCPSPLQLATGTNWDKGLVGAARSACCWQQAAEPLPALCLHELEGSRQCAVHGCLAHALAPCPWRAPKMAVPRPHLLPVGPWGEGIFFQLHPGFVVFSPCPCSAARGYRPLPGWGAAPRDSWCVCPPPPHPAPGHTAPLCLWTILAQLGVISVTSVFFKLQYNGHIPCVAFGFLEINIYRSAWLAPSAPACAGGPRHRPPLPPALWELVGGRHFWLQHRGPGSPEPILLHFGEKQSETAALALLWILPHQGGAHGTGASPMAATVP